MLPWLLLQYRNMTTMSRNGALSIFYGLSACSWVPHWACHYYRLETESTFVVGSWSFSSIDSIASLLVYGSLIVINLVSIPVTKLRVSASLITGLCHVLIGSIHIYRLWNPFTFEVFGYPWPYGASIREAVIVFPFGLLCLFVSSKLRYRTSL